jgi:hypothetical protein
MNGQVFTKELTQKILGTSHDISDEYVAYLNKIFQERVMRQIARSLSLEKLKKLTELEKSGSATEVKKMIDDNITINQQEEIVSNETDILLGDLLEAGGDLQKVEAMETARNKTN